MEGTGECCADVFRRALGVLSTNKIEVVAHGARLKAVRKRYGSSFGPYLWEFSNLLERLNERLEPRASACTAVAPPLAEAARCNV
jgi:hypothetical protein